MFKYDEEKNVLEISKIERVVKSNVYEESDACRSYRDYIERGVIQDIREQLIPTINEVLEKGECASIGLNSIRVEYDATTSYQGNKYYSVLVSIICSAFPKGTHEFCIFKIPFMDEHSVLNREGKNYAVINVLEQADDITYERKSGLKVITNQVNITIDEPRVNKFKFRNRKYSTLQLLAAMCKQEGIDPRAMLNKFKEGRFTQGIKKAGGLEIITELTSDAPEILEVVKEYASEKCRLGATRRRLNEVLSIDRALEQTLAKDMKLKDEIVLNKGTVVTRAIIKQLKLNKVNEVYVKNIPNSVGQVLAEMIVLQCLRKGSEVVESIPIESKYTRGGYVDDYYILDTAIVISENTEVTEGFLEFLEYNDVKEVVLKPKVNSVTRTTVSFCREIIGNRHYRRDEIGLGDSAEYVYVEENGEVSEERKYLTVYDYAAMMSLAASLENGNDFDFIASRDLGLRKRVSQVGDLFKKAFRLTMKDYKMRGRKAILEAKSNGYMVLDSPDKAEAMFFMVESIWWKVLREDLKVIQQVDTTNPISFYSSLSHINTIVVDSNSISDSMRGLTMGHYGRICLYETPQSSKLGVVNNKAIGCKLGLDGILRTEYYPVKHIGGKSYVVKKSERLTVQEEEKYRIADITSLRLGNNNEILNTNRVFARIPAAGKLEKVTAAHVSVDILDYVNVNPNQTISNATATIPFLGSDDAVRATFETSMVKQAKAVMYNDVPVVMTSANVDIPRVSPYFQINAEYDGAIFSAEDGYVQVKYEGIEDIKEYKYDVKEFNTVSVIIRTLEVEEGDVVKAGDILVSSNYTKDGFLAMGVNALVGFNTIGYNYEDGVYVANRLKHRLTSYGSNKESKSVPEGAKTVCVRNSHKFRYVAKKKTAYETRSIIDGKKVSRNIVADKLKGYLVRVEIDVDQMSKEVMSTTARSISFDAVNEGDKVANRHGNKGVMPVLADNENMPTFRNGEFLDIVYNPLGVISRMNIGQILELNLGLACHVLGIRSLTDSFNGAQEDDILLLLSYAWHLANEGEAGEKFNVLPKALRAYCESRIDKIRFWKDSFNEDGTAWMFNPRTGKMFNRPMIVGINHVYKLVHESAKKLHARGGLCSEPYVEKLDSPTEGAAQRGGQRNGYMELDAYCAYGASALISEMQNERCDNGVARNNLTVSALHKGTGYLLDESTGMRRSTEHYLSMMDALGVHCEFEGELPANTRGEAERRVTYTSKALVTSSDVGKQERKEVMSLSDFSDKLDSEDDE